MVTFILETRRRHCLNLECRNGGVPCDCVTKVGKPRRYCRVTHTDWVRSHPCPICIPEDGESDA